MNASPETIIAWHPTGQPLALAVVAARAESVAIREHVRSYSVPLFRSFEFCEQDGRPITDPDRAYLMGEDADQESRFVVYLDRLRAEHLRHGYQVKKDECPALMADRRRILAEDALLDSLCSATGIPSFRVYGRLREQMLDAAVRYGLGEGVPA